VTVVTMDVSAEPAESSDEQLVRQLVDRARAEGLKLTGEGGLLGRLTKVVVESALEGEMDDHLGYGKHDPAGRNGGNPRNGTRPKTLVTEAGPVEIEVPRDRESAFEPVIVGKRFRWVPCVPPSVRRRRSLMSMSLGVRFLGPVVPDDLGVRLRDNLHRCVRVAMRRAFT
jgi:hypothetical protein